MAKACQSGPAFTIISGFAYGLLSTFPPIIGIGGAALAAYKVCEPLGAGYPLLGIAMSAIGMLSVVGMIISNDAYGPIVDNARGMAEMAGLGDDVLRITDELDAAGNTAKAITKGFSIGAAGLTVIALLMSNAGGMWDNAKKYIEAGNFGGKGSDAHKAAVIGDTVGDPFKDTAGPSINTQITVVSLVSSLSAAIFLTVHLF